MSQLQEKIQRIPFSKNRYFTQEFEKKQIFLHHTRSHSTPMDKVNRWKRSGFKMGAPVIIAGKPGAKDHFQDGQIFQCFSAKYWAIHLGLQAPENQIPFQFRTKVHSRLLEKHSIAVEICNAGHLVWEQGRFYSSFRSVVPEEDVIEYVDKYRQRRFFHKYTDAQIASLKDVLIYLTDKYQIPKTYQDEMWGTSVNALEGQSGIFTHASVRTDLAECHPQPELVNMLQNISNT